MLLGPFFLSSSRSTYSIDIPFRTDGREKLCWLSWAGFLSEISYRAEEGRHATKGEVVQILTKVSLYIVSAYLDHQRQ